MVSFDFMTPKAVVLRRSRVLWFKKAYICNAPYTLMACGSLTLTTLCGLAMAGGCG
jgi:hypothetical protein